jgi:hypothetical protein
MNAIRGIILVVSVGAGCDTGLSPSSMPPIPRVDLQPAQPAGSLMPPPKTGSYTGPMMNPQLDTEADCTDAELEPNDVIATATDLSPLHLMLDGAAGALQDLAICPTGPNPLANGGHDVDVYQLTLSQSGNALVQITYDVELGDLDLGLYNSEGALLVGDGTAVSDGCVVSTLTAGTYFIGVFGANDSDSNRYKMSIAYSSTSPGCSM